MSSARKPKAGSSPAQRREAVLERVRRALEGRPPVEHPGTFQGWRPEAERPGPSAVEDFARRFREAGGEVVRVADLEEAREYVTAVTRELGAEALSVGAGVPDAAVPDGLERGEPRTAPLGLSLARGAVAETGSLVLDARDGRAAQLLPPVHLVLVPAAALHLTLAEAFAGATPGLPSAIGLHSGPSKSADIGKVMVTGVHGPGRLVALVVGA